MMNCVIFRRVDGVRWGIVKRQRTEKMNPQALVPLCARKHSINFFASVLPDASTRDFKFESFESRYCWIN